MIRLVLECKNFVIPQPVSLWRLFLIDIWRWVRSQKTGKKTMLFPFLLFKKSDKQILKTYPPVSLLPVCGKIFEKLIFNKIFKIFIENNLISPNQSGFKSGDSCVNQLLCITPDIIKSFGCGYKVRGVFLNI